MLVKNKKSVLGGPVKGLRIAIIASRYNTFLTDALLKSTQETLSKSGVKQITVFRVPGSYEIPVVAMKFAQSRKYHAIIALGIVLKGNTSHAEHISTACAINLQRIAIKTGTPIIHQILTPKNLKDGRARVRIRGIEAAQTAVEMGALMRSMI